VTATNSRISDEQAADELELAGDQLSALSDAIEIIASTVANSVVAIKIERPGPTPAPGFDTRSRVGSVGSGVVASTSGLIVTAAHVVDRAEQVIVTTPNGDDLNAKLVGRNESVDLAILQVDASDLTPITPSAIPQRPGQLVLVIGRPPVAGYVVTNGIVSAVDRPTRTFSGMAVNGLIQTTAAVEPGVSGGALADSRGALLGIITSATDSIRAISFAVPIEQVLETINTLAPADAGTGVLFPRD
jgi:S1-C subfamily serine protease